LFTHNFTVWLVEPAVLLLEFPVQALPLLVEVLPVVLVLLDRELLFLRHVHAQRLLEREGVDLLQDGLEGDERLLEDPAK